LEQQLHSFSVILQFKFGKMKLQKCWSQSLTALRCQVDGDFTRKRKANTKTPVEVLYDDVVDPATSQSSKETSGTFPLLEKGFWS